jgi:tetratricopeptide (TPR) repeat protein
MSRAVKLIVLVLFFAEIRAWAQNSGGVTPTPAVGGTLNTAQAGPSSQPSSPNSSQPSGSPQPPFADATKLAQLSERIDSELRASREHFEALRDTASLNTVIFLVIGGGLSLLGIISSVRQGRQDRMFEARLKESDERQTRQDKAFEARLKESDDQRKQVHDHALTVARGEDERRSAVHERTMAMLEPQLAMRQEEGRNFPDLLKLQHENIKQINALTASVAAGAKENVQTIHQMFAAIASILEFKAQEAKDVQEGLKGITAWRAEREAEELQSLEDVREVAVGLRASRHAYANPNAELRARLDAYALQFDRIGDRIIYRLTHALGPTSTDVRHAELFLRRGTIAYYANDIVRARRLLRDADRFYAVVGLEAVKADPDLARPCGFTKFYLSLVEKNYGDISSAKELIASSWVVWGRGNEREFLTPTVRAEILCAQHEVDAARSCLADVMQVVDRLRKAGQELPAHEAVYVARGHLLLGDTYFIAAEWADAEKHYEAALDADRRAAVAEGKAHAGNYYAQHALAQVYERSGRHQEAVRARLLAHQYLIASSDLVNKRALDTQILLHALGVFCTRLENAEKAREYFARVKQLCATITAVDGLELRLFSLKQKKQIPKGEFVQELANLLESGQ